MLLSVLGPDAYAQWAWRIAFLLGAAMASALYLYHRRRVQVLPAAPRKPGTPPLREVFTGCGGLALAQLFVPMAGLWLSTNMAVVVLAGQLKAIVGPLAAVMLLVGLLQVVTVSACGPIGAYLTERFPAGALAVRRTGTTAGDGFGAPVTWETRSPGRPGHLGAPVTWE